MNSPIKKPPAARKGPPALNRLGRPPAKFNPVPAQPKTALPAQSLKQSVTPPVYRPQSLPRVAQAKPAVPPPKSVGPQAPAVYRPEIPLKTVQTKAPNAAMIRKVGAPPIYRPQVPKILQPKAVSPRMAKFNQAPRPPVAPPAYQRAQDNVQRVNPPTRSGSGPVRPATPPIRPPAGNHAAKDQVVQPALLGLGIAAAVIGVGAYAYREYKNFMNELGEATEKGLGLGAEMAIQEMDPFPHPIFRNSLPRDLENERLEYLAQFEATKDLAEEHQAYIVTFQREPQKFHRKVLSGQKFLWAYDVFGRLSIGSPTKNKHAIVADGEDVFAAGTGHLKVSKAEQDYQIYQHLVWKAEQLRKDGFTDEKSNPYIAMAREKQVPRPAQLGKSDIVVLDFDSGHYGPSDAWRRTRIAWAQAGFFVEKSTTARHV